VTKRERDIFAAFTAAVVAPQPHLPPVEDTDATAAFDDWLTKAPRLNALALQAALHALDLAPVATGPKRTRFRKLTPEERTTALLALERAKQPPVRQAIKALKGIAFLCYYGDDGIMRTLGYDADANIARARRLRAAEGRP
jgi:hypothetical protein